MRLLLDNHLVRFCSRCLSPAIRESELQRVVQSRSHEKYANFGTEVCGNDVTASYEEDEVKLSSTRSDRHIRFRLRPASAQHRPFSLGRHLQNLIP